MNRAYHLRKMKESDNKSSVIRFIQTEKIARVVVEWNRRNLNKNFLKYSALIFTIITNGSWNWIPPQIAIGYYIEWTYYIG